MFIFVTYKDAPELSTILRRQSATGSGESIDLAVERTLLVNPDCPVRIMLEYIRKKCKLGIFTNFDLCDESGRLKGLFGMPTYAYATKYFEHKRMYYVIVIKQENEKRVSVLPQLNRENQIYTRLKDRCKRYLTGDLSSEISTTTPPRATPKGSKISPKGALKKN